MSQEKETNGQFRFKLGDLLVSTGLLSEEDLKRALSEQKYSKKRLGEILIGKQLLTERQLAEVLSRQLRIPLISLARYRPMGEALRLVPENVARRLELVPLAILDNNRLMVAMADPLDVLAIDEVRILTGMDVEVGIATPTEIFRDLDKFYQVQGSLDEAMVEVVESSGSTVDLDREGRGASADDAPVVKLVNSIMEQAVREAASDIHIEPFEKVTRVRYRVDGSLFDAIDFPRKLHPAVSSRIKIMANIDISEKRRPQDGRILIKTLNKNIDLRVSTLPTIYGEKVVLRLLDQSNAMVGLERLGLGADDREIVDGIIASPYGIILVTGPTGSGKSTTLYSVLERLSKPEVNIISVEDPVEYTMMGINQIQVNEKAGLTFSEALRSILRQDPDKIMVGEIRDLETAQLAVRAALTGHLVLSTLHTNDAPSASIRLIEMGIAPFLVSSSLLAVVAQRLVRKLCGECKQEYVIPDRTAEDLGLPKGTKAFKPVGCEVCRGTGYKGRSGIYEIMKVDEEIQNLILEGVAGHRIQREAIRKGMRTLRDSGLVKVREGVTSLEEVLQVTLY
ncbi:MAG TPA: ATPase, T2SS/T4P/T4SS family [Synergistales bacterium]|nr:ATPase, T2SS/T4P/T4SS family [Synergistales bacterium]